MSPDDDQLLSSPPRHPPPLPAATGMNDLPVPPNRTDVVTRPNPLDTFARAVEDSDIDTTGLNPAGGTRRNRNEFEEGEQLFGAPTFGVPSFASPTLWTDVRPDYSGLVGRVAQRRRLTPDATQELLQFSNELPASQLIRTYGALLEISEYISLQSAAAEYKLSENLKTNVTNYCIAFVCSPKSSAYLHGAIEIVLGALRARGIPMPSADDVARIEQVKSRISAVLTDRRSKLKSAIEKTLPSRSSSTAGTASPAVAAPTASDPAAAGGGAATGQLLPTGAGAAAAPTPARTAVPPADKKVDIATLCKKIVAKAPIMITLDFYHRVAFLRYCLVKFGSDNNFWGKVDSRLALVRTARRDDASYNQYFIDLYNDDIVKYGEAKRGGYVLPHQLTPWQVAVEEASRDAASVVE